MFQAPPIRRQDAVWQPLKYWRQGPRLPANYAAKDAKLTDTIKSGVKKVRGMLGLKSGGSVSSASKRADGCAIKGKTRGRMV